MEKSWQQIDEESEKRLEQQLEHAKKKSNASRDFFEAAISARRSIKQDDLLPTRTEFGGQRYTASQGIKAACLAREDSAITLTIQKSILHRLDSMKTMLWICTALLAYIAIRLS
jgi:hypothetical protein